MDSEKKLSSSIVATVKSADVTGLAKNYAEVGLDSILSEGLLRDIPIVSTLVAIGKVGISINDQIFAKKLVRFLGALAELSVEERVSMVERLDAEEGYRNQVGDKLIEILDRVDSQAKPEMVAKAFRAYADGRIDFEMLNRLNNAIERLPCYEIKFVRQFHVAKGKERHAIPLPTLSALTSAGLANPTSAWDAIGYKPTVVCDAFVSIGLDQ